MRNILITLHALFPHELLPALDLLDRRLVTRFQVSDSRKEHPLNESAQEIETRKVGEEKNVHYHVRSVPPPSSNRRGRYQPHHEEKYYEVRLEAWNCTCAAFVFSAFSGSSLAASLPSFDAGMVDGNDARGPQDDQSKWGGQLRLADEQVAPICKHLFAAVLAENCKAFRAYAVEKDSSVNDAAGWAAGWGD